MESFRNKLAAQDESHKYLLLLAVKDVIKNRSDSITNLDQLVDMLFGSSNTSEENIQNVVAESLGLLFIHHGMDMSAHYSDKFNSPLTFKEKKFG